MYYNDINIETTINYFRRWPLLLYFLNKLFRGYYYFKAQNGMKKKIYDIVFREACVNIIILRQCGKFLKLNTHKTRV